jgi:hypothetical protein
MEAIEVERRTFMEEEKKVAVVVGSLRQASLTRKVYGASYEASLYDRTEALHFAIEVGRLG